MVELAQADRRYYLKESVRESYLENYLYRLDPSNDSTFFALGCSAELSPEEIDKTTRFIRNNFQVEYGREYGGFWLSRMVDFSITVSSTFYLLKVAETLGRLDTVADPAVVKHVTAFVAANADEGGFKEWRYGKIPTMETTIRAFEIGEVFGKVDEEHPPVAQLEAISNFLLGRLDERSLYYNAMVTVFLDKHGLVDGDRLQRIADLLELSEGVDVTVGKDPEKYSGVFVDQLQEEVTTFSTISAIRLLRVLDKHSVDTRRPNLEGLLEFVLATHDSDTGGFSWGPIDAPNIDATYDMREILEYLSDAEAIDPKLHGDLLSGINRFAANLRDHSGGYRHMLDQVRVRQ